MSAAQCAQLLSMLWFKSFLLSIRCTHPPNSRISKQCCYYIGVQWNLSIKDALNKGHQSNEDTMYLLLTLGVHAPQGNSSCVCVCVCLVRFFQTVTNQEDQRIASALQSLDLKCGVFVKQPLREDTELEWQPYWCTSWPFCLLSQAPVRISIHVMLLSTTWSFCYGLCHCVWPDSI